MPKCEKFEVSDETCIECEKNNVGNHQACFAPANSDAVKAINKAVDHPGHYNQGNRRECIEEMRIMFGDEVVKHFCIGNAFKYQYRAGEKAGESRAKDLEKANWYLGYVVKMGMEKKS